MSRKRVTYCPSKTSGVFGVIWGGLFVLIGLSVVIPMFGPFGILWTVGAIAITAMCAYQTFSKKYVGPEIHIEDEDPVQPSPSVPTEDEEPDPVQESSPAIPSNALDTKGRLEQLESLKHAGLITQKEYEQKRRDILERL